MRKALLVALLVFTGCGNATPIAPQTDGGPTEPECTCVLEPEALYSGTTRLGGLDRIFVERNALKGPPQCATIILVSPGTTAADAGFQTPSGWGYQEAFVRNEGCDGGFGTGPLVAGDVMTGVATFNGDAGFGYPQTVNLHANLEVRANDAGIAVGTIRFDVDDLAVPIR